MSKNTALRVLAYLALFLTLPLAGCKLPHPPPVPGPIQPPSPPGTK